MNKLALTLFALVISFIASDSAIACSCASPGIDTEEKFKAVVATSLNGANAVFSGKVVEIDTFTVKFSVEKVWKGDFKDELVMITGTIMTEDGSYISSTCDYDFELNKKYLIFAYGTKDKLKATKCSWTSLLSERGRFVLELDRLKQMEINSQQSKAVIKATPFQSWRLHERSRRPVVLAPRTAISWLRHNLGRRHQSPVSAPLARTSPGGKGLTSTDHYDGLNSFDFRGHRHSPSKGT